MTNEDTARRWMGPAYEGSSVQRKNEYAQRQAAVKDRQSRIMRGEIKNQVPFGRRKSSRNCDLLAVY